MLRVHFLNVGHGDCTVIAHPSGRLTMIDINNSQEYDTNKFSELVTEELRKSQTGILAHTGILQIPPSPSLMTYAAVAARGKHELTDPTAFMQNVYPGRRLSRFVLMHPDPQSSPHFGLSKKTAERACL